MEFDEENKTFTLQRRGDPNWKGDFSLMEPEPERITLTGKFGDRQVGAKLRRADEKEFLLTSRGFHWINEYPLNR